MMPGDSNYPGLVNSTVNCALYDLHRLAANLATVRQKISADANVIAALKGDAYGHGSVPVARLLVREGVDTIMTGSYDEASAIKAADPTLKIILFAATPPDGIAQIIDAGLIPTIVDEQGANGRKASVLTVSLEHLTLDLENTPNAAAGDEVVLLGHQADEQISIEQMAGWSGLSALEIVSGLCGRVPASYIGAAKVVHS